MPQTSISITQSPAFAGQLADASDHKDVLSYTSEEASAEIGFGLMVMQGSAEDTCLIPTTETDLSKFLGVVVHSHAYDKPNALGDYGLKPKVTLGALARGRIWVVIEQNVAVGDPVFVRTDGMANSEKAGDFRMDADTNGAVQLPGARWIKGGTGSGTAPGLALLELDITARGLDLAD